ncbi:MAG: hypothetical protein GXO28_05735 [Methanopyri archaeon]|nr:hypothetical protein [Methanopyri archaeon]
MRTKVTITMEPDGHHEVAVVVDALRATSTMVTLLALGAEAVIPLSKPEDLKKVKDGVTVGEHHGEKIPFADFGNSPTEIIRNAERIEGQTVYMVTTNGTSAVRAADEVADEVLIGSLLNLTGVSKAIDGKDALLLEAGHRGGLAVEDMYTAGAIAANTRNPEPTDPRSRAALEMAKALDPYEVLAGSRTAHVLETKGKSEDVEFCSRVDEFPDVIGIYEDGTVVRA